MQQAIRLLSFSVLLLSFSANAQRDTLSATMPDTVVQQRVKPAFKLGVYYITELNFYGRVDSLRTAGFFPMAEFQVTKHWYINAAPVFVSNANGVKYGGSIATTGLRFTKPNKYMTHVFVVKPFYRDDAQIVQSAMKLQLGATHSFLNKIVNVTIGGDTKYSDRFDYALTAGLDHIFKKIFRHRSVLVWDPSAYINAGTQRLIARKNNPGILPGIGGSTTEQEISQLNILSYEFSMPIVYVKGKTMFIANPAFVMPQNLVKIDGRPNLSEYGKNLFYATLGVKYNF